MPRHPIAAASPACAAAGSAAQCQDCWLPQHRLPVLLQPLQHQCQDCWLPQHRLPVLLQPLQRHGSAAAAVACSAWAAAAGSSAACPSLNFSSCSALPPAVLKAAPSTSGSFPSEASLPEPLNPAPCLLPEPWLLSLLLSDGSGLKSPNSSSSRA
ncbi:hypothetical protein COO60DRAFT_1560248 [Scenedesmus sp. NREL 46B-D3]|nr:hypothetical protein COO60DRAFT_1560248 [Scenedesmus sp. NREL 46B-D3]